ncbi:MAG: hypothetical protein EBZ48_01225 [Proteobacteria bacterium]|nr:hypothetical protein [Pseudomonadota bacterium]
MEVQSELLRELQRRGEVLAQKMGDLKGELSADALAADMSRAELAEKLLQRAPIEFLQQHSARELVDSTELVAAAIRRLFSDQAPVAIEVGIVAGRVAFAIALQDRPFIVNTVMECCREEGIRISTLLHPVLSSPKGVLSLNYLELEASTVEPVGELRRKLLEALTQLIPVTDDYRTMLARIDKIRDEVSQAATTAGVAEREELAEFAKWLTRGNFNFFGLVTFEERFGKFEPMGALGLCKETAVGSSDELLSELLLDVASLHKNGGIIFFNSLLSISTVHRRTRLSSITIREVSQRGEPLRFTTLVGLFTSKAVTQECSSIPFVRHKFEELARLEGLSENTHDFKSVENILDSLPKETSLGLDVESLRLIVNSVLGVATSSETVTSVWPDQEGRGVYVLVVMTRARFDSSVRQSIEEYLERLFNARPITSEHHLDITNRPVVRLYLYVPTSVVTLKGLRIEEVRTTISGLARSWTEELNIALAQRFKNGAVPLLMTKYEEAFADGYRASQTVHDCVEDISQVEGLSATTRLRIALANHEPTEPASATIVVYSAGEEITISQAVPVLENFGFSVISERSWKIAPMSTSVVTSNRFRVRTRSGNPIQVERFKAHVASAMAEAFSGAMDNDILNTLTTEAGLDTRAVALLRSYCRFLWQVKRFASRFSIYRTLSSNPELSARLWRVFETLFNPKLQMELDARKVEAQREAAELIAALRVVKDITTDRIFRSILMLMEHTVRTNLYQGHAFIALKFRSDSIDIMPQPRPMFEIFVNSTVVEGVHLRSGMVARGGIRWSDRVDDYRSEVLGLMKTQRIKNALIVPTGAKGGFIVKNLPTEQKLIPIAVQEAYSEYIRAMLSIADTRVDTQVVRPAQVLAYEGDDPYFVVAADKGTATFSDVANRLATGEYKFWLGDAFASGGSNGYDHKKYGITAKGGWECVTRHFRDRGIEFEKAPFTAVGIGDMAGDVFGNGLLLSSQVKLLAAFNHKHVFLDPEPDPRSSFEERKRLFELPGSQWSDYQSAVISSGGGVFDRFSKEIPLTPEVRSVLGIGADTPDVVSGETLINLILKAPVDLLWNGGIGTYVKSRLQNHAEVSDSANDAVRINADELRCRVIGEGGNLGLTQAARIEASRLGVALNTDAIDNSGGVDLSDHEVNLKIFFSRLIQNGKFSTEERNTLLQEMAPEVCEAVLHHNRSHALLLTLSAATSPKRIMEFQALLRELVKLGYVNRALDNLPDDEELQDRSDEGSGMTRPELAVCAATAKMWVKDIVLSSHLLAEPMLQSLLLEYFPGTMQQRWPNEIIQHPLARNILATQIANTLIDGVGITPLHHLATQYGVPPTRVIECALAAELIFDARTIRAKLIAIEPKIGTKRFIELVELLSAALVESTSWLVSRQGLGTTLAGFVERYSSAWKALRPEQLPVPLQQRHHQRIQALHGLPIDAPDAMLCAFLPEVSTIFDLLWCAQEASRPLGEVSSVYSAVNDLLMAGALIERCRQTEARTRWDNELLLNTEFDIRSSVAALTTRLASLGKSREEEVAQFLQERVVLDRWRVSVAELLQRAPELSALAVISRQIKGCIPA